MTALTRRSGKVVGNLTNAIVESSPAVVDGVAYFGATDGRLFAVDADTGRIRGRTTPAAGSTRPVACTRPRVHHHLRRSIFCLRQRDGTKPGART